MDGLIGWLFVACVSAAPPAPAPVPSDGPPVSPAPAPAQPPPVAADTFVQLSNLATGWTYRIATDGRYLVTPRGAAERQELPISRSEPGARVVSPAGLARIRAALDEAGFHALPDVLETPVPDPPPVLRGGDAFRPVRWAFSARGPDGVKTVEVVADVRVPSTLGPLAPVYRALDHEALGDWQGE